MIFSFASRDREAIWRGEFVKRIPVAIQPVARRKLRMLNSARSLGDVRIPPANRLESLKGDRKGQYSIRINDQWRICFNWLDQGVTDVQIVDYH